MGRFYRERFPKGYKRFQELYGEVRYEFLTEVGHFYLWSKVLRRDGLIVSIDLPRTYRKSLNRFFRSSFFGQGEVHFLRQDSQLPETKEKLAQKLRISWADRNGESVPPIKGPASGAVIPKLMHFTLMKVIEATPL